MDYFHRLTHCQLSVSMGSASMDSTNRRFKNIKKKSRKFHKVKPEFAVQLFTYNLHYITAIYMAFTVFGICNLEMISSKQEDVHRLHANDTPSYIRDLSIHGFQYT